MNCNCGPVYSPYYSCNNGCGGCGGCGGYVTLGLNVEATPTTYTNVGDVITLTYTITNTGSSILCAPIEICNNKVGTQYNIYVQLAPGAVHTSVHTYTITGQDYNMASVTFSSQVIAYIEECYYVTSNNVNTVVTRTVV